MYMITSVPGVASSYSDVMKVLLLKPAGSIASVMLTGKRVIVNGFCVLLNSRRIVGRCRSLSMTE